MPPTMRSLTPLSLALASGLASVGCAGEPECRFPPTPSDASTLVFVCAGASGDGSSPSSPIGRIEAGLAAASTGATVVLAAGRYAENVVITRPVALDGGDGSAEIAAPADDAIVIASATGVTLRGLSIVSPRRTGVWLKSGSEAVLEAVRVEGATGFGVLAMKSRLELRTSLVKGSSSVGVELWDGSTGIIDTNDLSANTGGGLRIDDATSMDDAPQITNNTLSGNGDFGIGVFGSVAIIDTNDLNATFTGGTGADGVVVSSYQGQAPSNVTLKGNRIEGNQRVGVLIDASAKAIIDTNDLNANGKSGLFGAGVWLQQAGNATITKNRLDGNSYVGIGLHGSAVAIIDTNDITGVPQSTLALQSVGDGVFLGTGATATVKNNTITKCWRAGVFTNAAAATSSVEGNTLQGNDFAMILQGQSALNLTGNAASMNTSSDAVELSAASVPAGTYGFLDKGVAVAAGAVVDGAGP
jgi:parallel beta-helix repeat protein